MTDDVFDLASAEAVTPRVTKPIFAAMVSGLAAGILAAWGVVVALGAISSVPSGSAGIVLFAGVFAAPFVLITGLVLAIFPIGPIWLVVASLLVLNDERSVPLYAIAGAISAAAPFLAPAGASAWGNPSSAEGWFVFVAWFAVSGAIGGALAGVRIRRALDDAH